MMKTNRLIVESAVKAALKEASGLQVVSAEAVEWVNEKTVLLVESCAAIGRRTPGGRLMAPIVAPDFSNAKPTVTLTADPEPRADGSTPPERVCQRVKEWRALSPEQKNEKLQKLYVLAPAINQKAIDLLREILNNNTGDIDAEYVVEARDLIDAAEDLES